jgi:hypothetical protein
MAVEQKLAVQQVPYTALEAKLIALKQKLERPTLGS